MPAKTLTKSKKSEFEPFDPNKINHINTHRTTEMTMPIADDTRKRRRAIKITNNLDAKDPTLNQLRKFLVTDEVGKIAKKNYVNGRFVCVDFSAQIHDLAEKAGIKCGFVVIYYDRYDGHAMCAFKTTDHGLVFVDFTRGPTFYGLRSFVGRKSGTSETMGSGVSIIYKDFFRKAYKPHVDVGDSKLLNITDVYITW
jgi:hypothetical protein